MNAPFRFAMLVVTIITIIENGAIVALTFVFREVRNVPQSALIVSMSVADLLIGLIVMPLALYYEFNITWELGLVVCDFWISADIMCSTASILSIAFISIDKYFSLIHSSRYFGRERLRWVRLFVGVTWATATFVAFSAGASGWARAKPLPPRDFHADLDQVIADWPMRVNFSNISLRQALEYVENLESDAASQATEEECTITNNPIFALYSGMVSFYLPATAILYFSCKIRWISALTLARHERITTQRMKMMKNKSAKRKTSLLTNDGDTEASEDDREGSGAIAEDDEAVFQEYNRVSGRGIKMARRSALGLRPIATQSHAGPYPSRRSGVLQAESAFVDELFSEESGTHNELTPVGENDVLPDDHRVLVPPNSLVSLPSVSSTAAAALASTSHHRGSSSGGGGNITEQITHRLSSWGEVTAHKTYQDHRIRRMNAAKFGVPTPVNTHLLSSRPPHPPCSSSGFDVSPTTSHVSFGRRTYTRRGTMNGSNYGCPDLPSSIRYIDETSFSERHGSSLCDNNPCPSVSARVAASGNIIRQRSSIRHRPSYTSGHGGSVCCIPNFFDEISLRFIDDSTVTNCARAELISDLLPLPNLPPGVIVPGSSGTQTAERTIIPNGNVVGEFGRRSSPTLSYHVPLSTLPSEFQLLESNPRRSTGDSSFRKRATSVLSKIRSQHSDNTRQSLRRDSSGNQIATREIRHSSIKRKISRLGNRLKHVDAGGHLSAIGEYRTYMKALRRKERRTATLWLATVITFLCCWAPFFFCYPLSCFIEVPVELMILLPWLGYANSTINPVLHAFVEPVYIRALARFILSLLPAHWL